MALNGVSLIEINDRTVESVWKKDCAEYWLKKIQESMDRCTGRRDIIEPLLIRY